MIVRVVDRTADEVVEFTGDVKLKVVNETIIITFKNDTYTYPLNDWWVIIE